jgi:hypothetical protein
MSNKGSHDDRAGSPYTRRHERRSQHRRRRPSRISHLAHLGVTDPSVDRTRGPETCSSSAACTSSCLRRDGSTALLSRGERCLGRDRKRHAIRHQRGRPGLQAVRRRDRLVQTPGFVQARARIRGCHRRASRTCIQRLRVSRPKSQQTRLSPKVRILGRRRPPRSDRHERRPSFPARGGSAACSTSANASRGVGRKRSPAPTTGVAPFSTTLERFRS